MRLQLEDHFNVELVSDADPSNRRRQVHGAAFSPVTPRVPTAPVLLHVAPDVASMIGLSSEDVRSEDFVKTFSGAKVPDGARPYAMCYGGHQFGNWAGQLGDGRVINLAEVNHDGKRWTLQLKGAGQTPYSRTADGLAVLRSSLREHLCSEAMHHLGIPTTRSLCLITTGDEVVRDVMYDGNPQSEKGAVICRVAPSFIRFGNFQIFASRGDIETLRQITDYTIRHYFPEIEPGKSGYPSLLRQVAQRTLQMVVHWQRVGFVHGVMNTDNMSIHGETIDYGPYGWLEGYDHRWTPNTTDAAQHRYCYGNQPQIALWNLVQLANAFYAMTQDAQPLQEVIHAYADQYQKSLYEMLGKKIGLANVSESDFQLLDELEQALHDTETDMTIFFRRLANVKKVAPDQDGRLFSAPVMDAFYKPDELVDQVLLNWNKWFDKYFARLQKDGLSDEQRTTRMNAVNPKYVLRNYMAQMAIDKAEIGDTTLIHELYELLRNPYDEQPLMEKWFVKRPDWARHKIGCSMLSCSS